MIKFLKLKRFIYITLLGLLTTGTIYANPTFETQKLLASDGTASDAFGYSVAIDGNTAVVGAVFDVTGSFGRGSVYIFEKSGGTWNFQQKLNAFDGSGNNNFGSDVAISGDTLIVGSVHDSNPGTLAGSAYVYVRSGSTWTLEQKLLPTVSTAYGQFGISVDVDGNSVIVGENGNSAGAAYVFTRSGTAWTQEQKLTGSATSFGENFGVSVAIDGDTSVVGAYYDDIGGNSQQGSAYVFVRSGTIWTEEQILTASDGGTNDLFGFALEVLGDTTIVGSPLDDVGSNVDQGSAYVYTRSGATWTEVKKITTSDGAADDKFGSSIAIEGDKVVSGAFVDDVGSNVNQGSAYIFERNSGGANNWGEINKLIASDGAANDEFGNKDIGISGGTIIIGSQMDDDNGSNSGSAYIFPADSIFTVTKTDDTNDGTCDSDCSLREAISAANATSTDDIINFASPLFDSAQTITLSGTVLTVNNNGKTTIDGSGADLLTISGDNLSRVFFVNSGAEIEINGVTISDGLAPNTYAQFGGALKSNGGNVTLNNSVVSGNSSTNTGGGLAVESFGKLTLNNTTVSNNVSTNGGGGGIYSNQSEVTINNSTISSNTALFAGGGIFIDSNISGGAISLNNSTITNNSGSDAGGIVNFRASNIPSVANTIIAGNNAPTNPDVQGSFNSLGYNLISKTDGSSGFGATGDQTGTIAMPLSANLGPLQDNGGTTFTHELLSGSPAINAGSNALIPVGITTDQRGSGFDRIIDTTVDIGSFESALPSLLYSYTVPSTTITFTIDETCVYRVDGNIVAGENAWLSASASTYSGYIKTLSYGNVTGEIIQPVKVQNNGIVKLAGLNIGGRFRFKFDSAANGEPFADFLRDAIDADVIDADFVCTN